MPDMPDAMLLFLRARLSALQCSAAQRGVKRASCRSAFATQQCPDAVFPARAASHSIDAQIFLPIAIFARFTQRF